MAAAAALLVGAAAVDAATILQARWFDLPGSSQAAPSARS
jgi:hypothetical protein